MESCGVVVPTSSCALIIYFFGLPGSYGPRYVILLCSGVLGMFLLETLLTKMWYYLRGGVKPLEGLGA